MDRLQALIALALVLAACDEKVGAKPPSSRVDKGKATDEQRSVDEFCDVHPTGDQAPVFELPALASRAAPVAPRGWMWVNVWATWCKPCLEELPLLRRWSGELGVTLLYLSVDAKQEPVDAFEKRHPEVAGGVRIADAKALPAYLTSLGLDGGAPIPVHVLVDPAGRTRCVRAGALSEDDVAFVRTLLR